MPTIQAGCELDVDRGPNWLFVKIRSPGVRVSNDEADILCLADQVWALLDRALTYRLVLEMDEIDVLRSLLIGQLVLLQKRIRRHGGMLRLSGVSADNRQVIESCSMADRFPAYRNRVEAVMGASGPKPR